MTTLTTKQSINCSIEDLKNDQQSKTNLSQSNERDYTDLNDLNCDRVIVSSYEDQPRETEFNCQSSLFSDNPFELVTYSLYQDSNGHHFTGLQQVDSAMQRKLTSSFYVVAELTEDRHNGKS